MLSYESRTQKAVYAATDEYLASLTDADLNRSLDLSGLGVGQQTLGWLLTLMLANVNWHTGEIACPKGLQGAGGSYFWSLKPATLGLSQSASQCRSPHLLGLNQMEQC